MDGSQGDVNLAGILGAVLAAMVAGVLGVFTGGKNKVSQGLCEERRESLNRLLATRFDKIEDDLDEIKRELRKGSA